MPDRADLKSLASRISSAVIARDIEFMVDNYGVDDEPLSPILSTDRLKAIVEEEVIKALENPSP